MLNSAEIKKRAIEFQREHADDADDADEKSQAQNFWRDFFGIRIINPFSGVAG
jgi:hypothetical protein